MRISDWSSDVCSSDLIHRQSSLERFSSKLRLRSYSSLSQAWTIPEIFNQSSQLGYLAYIRVGIFPFEWMEIFSDRKSVVLGKSVSVRVDLGGRRIVKKKTKNSY